MDRQDAKQRIEKLKETINHHRYLYHVLDKQEISDEALDSLKHELYKLEQDFPEFVTPDSPTQRVGGKPLPGFKKIKHLKQMVSLEDIFESQELFDWEKYLYRMGAKSESYFAELKVDGFAISLIYENGILKQAVTRGDGKIGEDVTENIKTIESIPLKLQIHPKNNHSNNTDFDLNKIFASQKILNSRIEVRGEVYMDKREFDRINKQREKEGLEAYANPRNLAAGSIRQLDPKIAASRKLSFMAYDLVSGLDLKTHQEKHFSLEQLGFRTDYGLSFKNLKQVCDFWEKIEKQKDKFNFLIDGIVVNIDDNKIFEDLGIVGKTPRGARALKFSPNQASTIIEEIEIQIGRTGVATPVAHLRPMVLGGVKITRATLHNMDQIKRLGVKIGDTVIVQRAGDVIPAVSQVLKELRSGKEKEFKMPEYCPVCGKKLERQGDDVAYRCINKECPAVHREKLYHFVSKKAFDIDGLGPEIIDALVENNLIRRAYDIFGLKKEDLVGLERFAEKSSQNLIDSIEKSRKITLDKFIYSLGIRHVGEETSVDLANRFKNIKNLQNADIGELMQIRDIGPKSAESIREWFLAKENIDLIDKLLENGVLILNPKKIENKLNGKIFVITGTMESLSREEAKNRIILLGGKVANSISKNTDYLVLGENPGSKLQDAKKLGIKIISQKELLKILAK